MPFSQGMGRGRGASLGLVQTETLREMVGAGGGDAAEWGVAFCIRGSVAMMHSTRTYTTLRVWVCGAVGRRIVAVRRMQEETCGHG